MTVLDLHLHSHFSDGNWSPSALTKHALEIGLKHIAITDHDTVSGITEAQAAAGSGLEIIPGVEINTVWNSARLGPTDIHILGYFIDPKSPTLLALLRSQQQARARHARRCVERLRENGIKITVEMVQQQAGPGGIGKMHLAKAIIEAGGAKDASEAFAKFLKRGSAFHLEKESITPEEAVSAINSAGGIASLAHPGKEEEAMLDLILELKRQGLTAIEAYHRLHSNDLVKRYINFARSNGLLVTGGSDCHGPYLDYQATAGTIAVPLTVLTDLRERLGCPGKVRAQQ